jgi:CRISPR-associated protein, Cas2 family
MVREIMSVEKVPNVILVYDIVDDRKRAKIADACLDYGLDRIHLAPL